MSRCETLRSDWPGRMVGEESTATARADVLSKDLPGVTRSKDWTDGFSTDLPDAAGLADVFSSDLADVNETAAAGRAEVKDVVARVDPAEHLVRVDLDRADVHGTLVAHSPWVDLQEESILAGSHLEKT